MIINLVFPIRQQLQESTTRDVCMLGGLPWRGMLGPVVGERDLILATLAWIEHFDAPRHAARRQPANQSLGLDERLIDGRRSCTDQAGRGISSALGPDRGVRHHPGDARR